MRSKEDSSIGVGSILKSPVWMITPRGVRIASATHSMVLCVTWKNSILNGPMSIVSPGADFVQLGIVKQAVLFEFLADQREREFRAVDGHVQVAKNIRNGADVVLVAVREDNRANLRLRFCFR